MLLMKIFFDSIFFVCTYTTVTLSPAPMKCNFDLNLIVVYKYQVTNLNQQFLILDTSIDINFEPQQFFLVNTKTNVSSSVQ